MSEPLKSCPFCGNEHGPETALDTDKFTDDERRWLERAIAEIANSDYRDAVGQFGVSFALMARAFGAALQNAYYADLVERLGNELWRDEESAVSRAPVPAVSAEDVMWIDAELERVDADQYDDRHALVAALFATHRAIVAARLAGGTKAVHTSATEVGR